MVDVLSFAREYINDKASRTPERQKQIKEVYKQITGEELQMTCSTCLIEALLKIKRIMEKKPSRYLLKPGAVLTAFGDSSKTCTNATLTDELAEWHLKNNPGLITLFSKVPDFEKEREIKEAIAAEKKRIAEERKEAAAKKTKK